MKQFVDAVRMATNQGNYYTALATALTLPDICVSLESGSTSGQAYAGWFDTHVAPKYTAKVGPSNDLHVFLSGHDAYALRCAFLHNGSDVTSTQRARQAIAGFQFVAPKEGWLVHRNQVNDKLQLQVDIFCGDICDGVDVWLNGRGSSTSALPLMKIGSLGA
jgi:hypothetical protein